MVDYNSNLLRISYQTASPNGASSLSTVRWQIWSESEEGVSFLIQASSWSGKSAATITEVHLPTMVSREVGLITKESNQQTLVMIQRREQGEEYWGVRVGGED